MIQITTELLKDFAFDVAFLMNDHYAEVGKLKSAVPLNIYTDAYLMLEKTGMLRVFTARDDGELIGYAVFLVQPQIHHLGVNAAHNLAVYLKPSYRGGTLGFRLLSECDRMLSDEAPIEILWGVTPFRDYSRALKRLGYSEQETIYTRYVGA